MMILLILIGFFAVVALGLQAVRWRDDIHFWQAWRTLATESQTQPTSGMAFTSALIADLPGPARRYFGFVFDEGAKLPGAMRIEMTGTLTMPGRDPMPMRAEQILAPPYGLAWRVASTMGAVPLSGADVITGDASWSRFWLARLIPVARAGASEDHWRAAFGRVVAEAVFWSPASLLPQNGAIWTARGADTARASLSAHGIEQSVDITLDATGQPVAVLIARWTDANPDKVFRLQPFGGTPSVYRTVQGIRYPLHVEGGNLFGTPDYAPFFVADVTGIDPIGVAT